MKTKRIKMRIAHLLIGFVTILTITECTALPLPAATQTPFPFSTGPLLLIQSGLSTYQIIDVQQQFSIPFDPPSEDERCDLAEYISPSGRYILFPDSAGNILVMDFNLAAWQTIRELPGIESRFLPEKAAEEALERLLGWDASYEAALSAIQDALSQSRTIVRWYKCDRYVLTVLEDDESSTHLYLNDLQTGEQQQLEGMPGMVQDLLISPDEEMILLKKGFIFEPNIWQDDDYYLVNMNTQEVQSIALPQDTDHPSLSWLDSQFIGVTHQTQVLGGVGFTLINSVTMKTTQIIESVFSQIQPFEESLLILRQDRESKTTSLERVDFSGQSSQSLSLDSTCVINSVIAENILLNCEKESLILDGNFQQQSFGDPIFLLSPAPDGQSSTLVTRNDEVFLLDGDLKERQQLALDGAPLEVRWLPDSSGFLYRTRGRLHYYDLQSATSQLLITSDVFDDYSNMNAVWVDID